MFRVLRCTFTEQQKRVRDVKRAFDAWHMPRPRRPLLGVTRHDSHHPLSGCIACKARRHSLRASQQKHTSPLWQPSSLSTISPSRDKRAAIAWLIVHYLVPPNAIAALLRIQLLYRARFSCKCGFEMVAPLHPLSHCPSLSALPSSCPCAGPGASPICEWRNFPCPSSFFLLSPP